MVEKEGAKCLCVYVVCGAVLGRVHWLAGLGPTEAGRKEGRGGKGKIWGRPPSFFLLLLAYLYRCG